MLAWRLPLSMLVVAASAIVIPGSFVSAPASAANCGTFGNLQEGYASNFWTGSQPEAMGRSFNCTYKSWWGRTL
jgi:hypothetical protein